MEILIQDNLTFEAHCIINKLFPAQKFSGKCYIYTLFSVTDGKVRYVGKTQNPYKRFRQHLKTYISNTSSKVLREWIDSFPKKDLRMEVIVFCLPEYAELVELICINLYKETGCDLLNAVGITISPPNRQRRQTAQTRFGTFGKL